MELKTVQHNKKDSVFAYLDAVLAYYKEAEDATLSEWPEESIGWNTFAKTGAFYDHVREWFARRNITIITCNNTSRYLSTFILAAEFPPTLGYARLVGEIVRKQGWLSLHRDPEGNLSEFVSGIDLNAYTVAQRESLKLNSDGYAAFLQLIHILAAIRYHLDSVDNLETICSELSIQQAWDIDMVLRIARAYRDIIVPPQKVQDATPAPKFTYQLIESSKDFQCKLVIKHNLQKATAISMPSSIELSRFATGTLSILADNQVVSIPEDSQIVKLECQDGMITLETSLSSDHLEVEILSKTLKHVQVMVTVRDQHAIPRQLFLGQLRRQDDFLVFDHTGNEIVSNTRLYRRGQVLRLVPLDKEIGEALKESKAFEQEEQTGMLPVFKALDTTDQLITFGTTTLEFRSIPFSFRLRDQNPWEAAFNKPGSKRQYFFSPMMQFQLVGDLSGQQPSTVELCLFHRNMDGKAIGTKIPTQYCDGTISPKQPLASPGVYELQVQFDQDTPSKTKFNLLPIKNITLVGDRHIRLHLYYTVTKFACLGINTCTCSWNRKVVDIVCDAYGTHEIDASYWYTDVHGKELRHPLKFKFDAIQEVVGHFSKVAPPGSTETLCMETDLINNSYLEFNQTSFRTNAIPYRISAYMEYTGTHQRLFPERRSMYTDGSRPFSLAPLVTYVKSHSFSRLLLLVTHGETELYRVEFADSRIPIINLDREWHEGRYNSLTALPLQDLTAVEVLPDEEIPDGSLVYGMVETETGTREYTTHATYVGSKVLAGDDLVARFLSLCNQSMRPDEQKQQMLLDIIASPDDAFRLLDWLSLAQEWRYPYDIKIFAKILDTYPILVAWAELARNPENRDQEFAWTSHEAKQLKASGNYFNPQLVRVSDHPRFSPELITLSDIKTLDELHLLPTDEGLNMKLCMFCTYPFISGSKPVLSWLTLFWLRESSASCGKTNDFQTLYQMLEQMKQPLAPLVAEEFTSTMPQYRHDVDHEQDFRKLLGTEHCHYDCPPLTTIRGLEQFLMRLEEDGFRQNLKGLIAIDPLRYAEPYVKGFGASSKWTAILFLSLTAVCTQLERQPFLDQLHQLWKFDHPTYVYLLKWMNNHEETARIYHAYYEYWMTCFWRKEHV